MDLQQHNWNSQNRYYPKETINVVLVYQNIVTIQKCQIRLDLLQRQRQGL